jgi:hypothetical protein
VDTLETTDLHFTFRIKKQDPQRVKEFLIKQKEELGRSHGAKLASYVIEGVEREIVDGKPHIVIPLDPDTTPEELAWLEQESTKNLLMILIKSITRNPKVALDAINEISATLNQETIKEKPA